MKITNLFPLQIQKRDPLLDMTQESRALYETFVSKNFDEVLEIALMTKGQAAANRSVLKENTENSVLHRLSENFA